MSAIWSQLDVKLNGYYSPSIQGKVECVMYYNLKQNIGRILYIFLMVKYNNLFQNLTIQIFFLCCAACNNFFTYFIFDINWISRKLPAIYFVNVVVLCYIYNSKICKTIGNNMNCNILSFYCYLLKLHRSIRWKLLNHREFVYC